MLSSLQLRDFRCFREVDLPLEERGAVFLGQNAQGKTSILESVCVLLRLQSPRTNVLREMQRFGADDGFFVGGAWGERQLRFGYRGRQKRLSVDGSVRRKAAEYLALSGRVVWMGNGDLRLVDGRGDGRRRYLDFIASQLFPEYLHALRSYERAVKARNHLLKDFPPPWPQVDAYTELLVRHGEIVIDCRARLVDLLGPWVDDAGGHLSGGQESPRISYRPSAVPGSLAQSLEEAREADARRGLSTVGPHRDDLSLEIGGRAAGTFGSEGQQRTLALALKLAQARLLASPDGGGSPILLIDDIFGELDLSRRNALLSYLPQESQKLITTTHLDWADEGGLDVQTFRVAGGVVTTGDQP